MRTPIVSRLIISFCLVGAPSALTAQEVVHAVTGKIISIDSKSKSIIVKPDDGSDGHFKLPVKQDGNLDFDKGVRAGTTPAAAFTKTNTQVLMYFTGFEPGRTVIAIQDLGATPLVKAVGSVVRYHKGLLTVKTQAGIEASFVIDDKTIAETPEGVMEGKKFSPRKDDQVRVVAVASAGNPKALFVREQ